MDRISAAVWEGGRRTREAPARTLLTVIDKHPAAVLTAHSPGVLAATVGSSKPTTIDVQSNRKRQRITKRKNYSAERVKGIAK